MSIFNEFFIKKHYDKKSDEYSKNDKEKFTTVNISSSNNSIFQRLYNNEALTAEGYPIDKDDAPEKLNDWFRKNSDCKSNNIDIFIIKGKDMNDHYHLTGNNKYDNNTNIVCIDWIQSGCKSPYKGSWRWFSDVVDNNAKREIAKGNKFYNHYHSMYYGDIGIKD